MHLLKYFLTAQLLCVSFGISQITLSGRFVQPNETNFDSATVVIKEPTADTVYAKTIASKDGSFSLKTTNCGTFMAEFRDPHYYTLRVALVVDKPTEAQIDVTLRSKADPHYNCRFVFRDSSSLLERFAALHFNENHLMERFQKPTPIVDQIDWKKELEVVDSMLAKEKEPLLRQELIIQSCELNDLANIFLMPDSIKRHFLEIPAVSPAWVYHLNEASILPVEVYPEPLLYVNELMAHHPDIFFVKYLFEHSKKGVFKDGERSSTNVMIEERPFFPTVRDGDAVPHFSLRSIDDTSKVFSDANLAGQMYLLDFWATWCGSCVNKELPELSKAFEQFKSHSLIILSISDDDSASTVVNFRKRVAMPWYHALGSSAAGLIKLSFGVWALPTPFLISPQGRVLAMGEELRGENLLPTLEKFIGK